MTLITAFWLALATSAQSGPSSEDFANRIRSTSDIQATLEYCDGHPEFETALANWLEMAEPFSAPERQAVRETSLRLLEDTTNRQLALALTDGLLRHALEDIRRDHTIVPEKLAPTVRVVIGRAVRNRRSKVSTLSVTAFGLAEDGTVTDERQARFLEELLNLIEPRILHVVRVRQDPEPAKLTARVKVK